MNEKNNKKEQKSAEEQTARNNQQDPLYIVGIGASAGGLEALREILSNLDTGNKNFAVIIAQHLSPNYKSLLVELLGKETKLQAVEIQNGTELQGGKLYITPRDSNVVVRENKLFVDQISVFKGPKPNIDLLFQSIGESIAELAIGVIVSGTGRDGAKGIQAIKRGGGLTIVQEPQTAKYDGMPIASIQTGDVDMVLSPDRIGMEINEYLLNPETARDIFIKKPEEKEGIKSILRLLSKRGGTDFSQYKVSTITRRLEKRVFALNLTSINSYLTFIQENPSELDELFNTILIGVTRFFRDGEAFTDVAKYIEKIISNKYQNEPIRIWVPGCATGEEAYSIAILISRVLREHPGEYDIQIFATDIDEKAIESARQGLYHQEAFIDMDKELFKEYFVSKGDKYEVIKSIKQLVLFSKHDITVNPPFLRLDLISCRNLLIYFDTALQKKVIPLFHYALNPNGFLFLGKSETVGQFSDLFITVEAKSKIFRRKTGSSVSPHRFNAFLQGRTQVSNTRSEEKRTDSKLSTPEKVKETLYKTFEHPYVVINDSLDIIEISGDINIYMSFKQGMMNANILRLICSELELELRGLLPKAVKDSTEIKSNFISIMRKSERHVVRLIIKPLLYSDMENQQFIIIFERFEFDEKFIGTGLVKSPDNDDPRINQLMSELSMTKENLQMYIEELETANEELQSLNEELQSTNEELQATNEELETSNEELQSTNEEIQIAYNELRETHEELENKEYQLQESKSNLIALLNNNLQAFVLLTPEFSIKEFNGEASNLFKQLSGKLCAKERAIFDYFNEDDISELHDLLKDSLKGQTMEGEIELYDKRGKKVWFAYSFIPVGQDGQFQYISCGLLNISDLKEMRLELTEKETLIRMVFSSSDTGISIVDEDGLIYMVNKGYLDLYGFTEKEVIGKPFTLVFPEENRREVQQLFEDFMNGKRDSFPSEWKVKGKDGLLLDVHKTSAIIEHENGRKFKVSTVRDVTDQQKYQAMLEETEKAANVGGWQFFPDADSVYHTAEVNRIFELSKNQTFTLDDFYAFCITEHRANLQKAMQQTIEEGDPLFIEIKIVTAKSNEKWITVTARAERMYNRTVSVYGSIHDITEAKNRELRLQENVEFLEALLHTIPGPVFFKDREGKYRLVNQRFCDQILGLPMEEIIGKSISELQDRIPKERAQVYIQKDRELFQSGEDQNYESTVLCADDKYRTFRFSKRLFKHSDGSPIGIVGVMTELEDCE